MMDQTPNANLSGETAPDIDGFRVIAKLGRGATSSVWKAEQISLNRLVVIKVLSERLTQDPEDVALFKAEARTAANCRHAGIVQVYDFGQSQKSRSYYFVMEYISGYSVGDWIRRKGKIAESEALVVVHGVADALKYAWDFSKIVHCDIKPDNIMVDGDGSIKVADLGLAHTVKSIASQPGAGTAEVIVTGTPNYMAPEQVHGSDPIDCRTDIYGLGASLYHMVTGKLPFGESSPDVVMERQLHEVFEYPQQVNPDLSTSVTRLILKMTAKDPAARFQTWDEVLAEVIRLERQMRVRESSDTQPMEPAGAPAPSAEKAGRPATPGSHDGDALIKEGRNCPYCGKPAQLLALYCAFCGKPMPDAAKKKTVGGRKENTIRLKPIPSHPPAGGGPSVAPLPPAAPLRASSSLGGNVCMVLSLCLLVFLGYYAYQKIRYGRDVLVTIKAAIVRAVPRALEKISLCSEQGIQRGAQFSHKVFWEPFLTKPAPPADSPKAAPTAIPALDENTIPSESPEPETASAAAPEAASLPPVVETAPPEAPAAHAAAPPPVPAEPVAAPVKASEDEEYDLLLRQCKQQKPKSGDRITIRFKDGRPPVEGVFDHQTDGGVLVKVPAGVIEYPFRLISDESRLLYFPEERARRIQSQKSGQVE